MSQKYKIKKIYNFISEDGRSPQPSLSVLSLGPPPRPLLSSPSPASLSVSLEALVLPSAGISVCLSVAASQSDRQ